MREDLQAAFRSLRTSTSFTIAALLVLTLAIGASTALFSVVDAVVLRGLRPIGSSPWANGSPRGTGRQVIRAIPMRCRS